MCQMLSHLNGAHTLQVQNGGHNWANLDLSISVFSFNLYAWPCKSFSSDFFQLSFCLAELLYIIWKSLKSETVILPLLESLKNSHLWGITRISYHAQTYTSWNLAQHPPVVFLLVDIPTLVRKTRKNSNIFAKILIIWYILGHYFLGSEQLLYFVNFKTQSIIWHTVMVITVKKEQ